MMHKLINSNGVINSDSINGFSYKKLEKFIVDVLYSRFAPTGGPSDQYPHRILLLIYRKLDPLVKESFRDILLVQLASLAQNPRSTWKSNAGDELLLLIADIFADGHEASRAIEHLRYIILIRNDLKRIQPNLHYRAAQTLVGLKHRSNQQFWIQLFETGGPAYAALAFAGLSLVGVSPAFEWLRDRRLPPEAFAAALARLPWLTEEYGTYIVSDYLIQILPYIPKEFQSSFRSTAIELDIPYLSSVLVSLKSQELRELGRRMSPEMSFAGRTLEEIAWILEQRLRITCTSYKKYKQARPGIQIISCFSEYVVANPLTIPMELRLRLYEIGTEFQNSLEAPNEISQYTLELFQLSQTANELEMKIEEIIRRASNYKE